MPTISIIVPVYNAEKYLNQCIQSILNQTFSDLEVILVDDGSKDNSFEICKEFQKIDSRIKVLNQENKGAGAARNVGLAIAKGEYIGFVDSDDWIEPNMYETLYELINKNHADMAICDLTYSSEPSVNNPNIEIWDNKKNLERFFRINGESGINSVCRRLVKRNLFDNWEFIEGYMNEDVHACFCLAFNSNKTIYYSRDFYHYRKNKNGVTNSKFTKNKLDLLYVWEIVRKQVENLYPKYIDVCEMNCKRARLTLLTKMYVDGYDHKDSFMIETKKNLKKDLRKSFFSLMRWKMPISRKVILLILVCIP